MGYHTLLIPGIFLTENRKLSEAKYYTNQRNHYEKKRCECVKMVLQKKSNELKETSRISQKFSLIIRMKASLQGCLSTLSSNQKQEGHLAFSFSPEAGPNTSRKFLDFS